MTEQEKREKVIAELERVADEANPWEESPPLRCDISYPLLIDALTLLKAQEPRVMTLEEAFGADECWLERKDGCITVADIALNGQDKGGYDVDSRELNTLRSYIFHSGYYGKYWRCWTARPDEKRRAETPWNT